MTHFNTLVIYWEHKMAIVISQPECLTLLTFTCSRSTIKALEKGVKYVQS